MQLLFFLPILCPAAESSYSPPPSILDVLHSPQQPASATPVQISAELKGTAAAVHLEYQLVDPGKYIDLKDPAFKTNWIAVPMSAANPAKSLYTATLPPDLQKHRRLIRYRIKAADAQGQSIVSPPPSDPVPNYAYFVYDGIPAWRGAIEPTSRDPKRRAPVLFGTNVMRSVQAYHLISERRSVENVTWREPTGGSEYRYTGTLVSDGLVYDHVGFRARGGGWRYAMVKNMWKFDFPRDHHLQARDDWGRPYRAKWGKLNLGACIQQADYGHRGEQGMFESVGFRLFNLAGVPAPRTHWVQLRIIDDVEEIPADQYQGDFWGLYLAMENEDDHFLKEHNLPDGNIYKMEGGTGTLSHQGKGAVANRSDLDRFLSAYYSRQQPELWWRTNLNLPAYYSYRSILECIHHYDVSEGKNYYYYLNSKTGQWSVFPWDIDLSWADNMYGGGDEPFKHRVLAQPRLRIEYQNRLREIRDLLYNPDQAGHLIDEYAAIIADPSGAPSMVDADRAKWDYHPFMAMSGKAGQGLYYRIVPTQNFAGMVQLMKNYVKRRGFWLDGELLENRLAPPPVSVTNTGSTSYSVRDLRFRCSEYKGSNAFAAIQWRLGEISKTNVSERRVPNTYEIIPAWESPAFTSFASTITIPASVAKPGRSYRVRARVQDVTGRCSRWSAPLEFVAAP